MSYEVVTANEIFLNNYKYRVRSPVVGSFIDPFPGQLSIGDASYNNQLELSSLVISDLSGGIGDEVLRQANRCFWTDCIIEYPGHILPPRLATPISTHEAGYHIPTGGSGGTDNANTRDGSTATFGYTAASADDSWSDYFTNTIPSITATKIRYYCTFPAGYFDVLQIDVYYSAGWHNILSAAPTQTAYTDVSIGSSQAVTQIRARAQRSSTDSGVSHTWNLYEMDVYGTLTTAPTPLIEVEFNGVLYIAFGQLLAKLNAGRTAFTPVRLFANTITALIASLNSRLYIYMGDSTNYWYMSTAEAFTQSNSAVAYWGIQYDAKLFKMATTGAIAYSTDPDGGAPTWTSGGAITDIVSQIEGFMIGNDASGVDALYVATNSILKVYDSATPQWLDTKVSLPNHPNGGKGAAYFNGAHYLSYGLAVKEYAPTAAINLQDIGLTERDGLPIEYNGEIVKLTGDTGLKMMFALVDASQTTGNSKSGLYAFDGSAWFCWWIDTANNGAMTDVIVSSASSGYAVYWNVGTSVYYIDIPRGVQNPDKISQSYGTAGVLLSPWFDAGDRGAAKLAKYLNDFAKGVTTTETVALSYRIDHATTTVDTVSSIGASWTTLETLNTTGEDGYNEEIFASGAGIAFKSIQFRLDFVTAGSTAKADIQNLKLLYRKRTGALKIRRWIVEVLLDNYANGPTGNATAKAKIANLKSALTSSTDVIFSHRPNAGSDESYYVNVECEKFEEGAGPTYDGGYYRLVLTEV